MAFFFFKKKKKGKRFAERPAFTNRVGLIRSDTAAWRDGNIETQAAIWSMSAHTNKISKHLKGSGEKKKKKTQLLNKSGSERHLGKHTRTVVI